MISPLLALIEDQVTTSSDAAFRSCGSTARSGQGAQGARADRRGRLAARDDDARDAGERRPAPAALQGGDPLFAIDEAHSASEWGHDFRPAYLRLGTLLERYGRPSVMALTATATEPVREDLKRILDLREPSRSPSRRIARTSPSR
ncbi:MAG: hypothetical protein R3E53_03865 [Myxococcota bacterium]